MFMEVTECLLHQSSGILLSVSDILILTPLKLSLEQLFSLRLLLWISSITGIYYSALMHRTSLQDFRPIIWLYLQCRLYFAAVWLLGGSIWLCGMRKYLFSFWRYTSCSCLRVDSWRFFDSRNNTTAFLMQRSGYQVTILIGKPLWTLYLKDVIQENIWTM